MSKTTSTSRAASNGAVTAALAEQVQQLDGVVRQLTQDLPSTMAQALSQVMAQSLGQAFTAAMPALAEEVSRQVRSEVALALAASATPTTPASPSTPPAALVSPEVSTPATVPSVAPAGLLSARVAVAERRLGEWSGRQRQRLTEWSGRQGQHLRQGREVVSRKAAQARAALTHKAGQVRQAATQQAEQVALWLKATRHLQKRALASLGVGLLLTLVALLLGPKACAALLCLASAGCAWTACAERGWPRPAAQDPAQGPVSSSEPTLPEEGGQPVIASQALSLAAPPDSSDPASASATPATATATPSGSDTSGPALPEVLTAQPGSGAAGLPVAQQQTDFTHAASDGQPSIVASPPICPVAPSPVPA